MLECYNYDEIQNSTERKFYFNALQKVLGTSPPSIGGVAFSSPALATLSFNGTPADQVPNIVKLMTGKSSVKVGKKSLLFVERVPVNRKGSGNDTRYSDTSYIQARVLTLDGNAKVLGNYAFDPIDDTGAVFRYNEWDYKKVQPVVTLHASSAGFASMYHSCNGTTGIVQTKYPIQNFPLTNDDSNPIKAETISEAQKDSWANLYGNGALSLHNYDGEVLVAAHSITKETMKAGDPLTLTFTFLANTSQDKLAFDFEKDLTAYTVDDNGLNYVDIATGDFDDDGRNNDIALLVCSNKNVSVLFHTLQYDKVKGTLSLNQRYQKLLYTPAHSYGTTPANQAGGSIFFGDFDGDKKKEVAAVYRILHYDAPSDTTIMSQQITICKYNDKTKNFDLSSSQYSSEFGYKSLGVQSVAADLDGDEIDEIVSLELVKGIGGVDDLSHVYANLYLTTFERGSIEPKTPYHRAFASGDGEWIIIGNTEDIADKERYYMPEAISMIAGPFTGAIGSDTTADRIAVSVVDTSSKLFVIPDVTIKKDVYDRDYPSLGYAKTIYDNSSLESSMSSKYDLASSFRGGLAAADFLAEGIEISDPEQLTDMHDPSYAVVLPAIPYHVDNIAPDGTELLNYPYNFTFSGFSGSGGAMSATYVKSVTSTEASQYKFGATTTQDTFFPNSDSKILGVADKYLQFERMKSHWFEKAAAGSKYEALAKAQAAMYDFFNNHSETVKTKMNESSSSVTLTDEISSSHRDAVELFDTTTYTWRYKISAAKPPMWLVVGGSIEENPVEIKGERNKYYIRSE